VRVLQHPPSRIVEQGAARLQDDDLARGTPLIDRAFKFNTTSNALAYRLPWIVIAARRRKCRARTTLVGAGPLRPFCRARRSRSASREKGRRQEQRDEYACHMPSNGEVEGPHRSAGWRRGRTISQRPRRPTTSASRTPPTIVRRRQATSVRGHSMGTA
jgi:hypothetical protein